MYGKHNAYWRTQSYHHFYKVFGNQRKYCFPFVLACDCCHCKFSSLVKQQQIQKSHPLLLLHLIYLKELLLQCQLKVGQMVLLNITYLKNEENMWYNKKVVKFESQYTLGKMITKEKQRNQVKSKFYYILLGPNGRVLFYRFH